MEEMLGLAEPEFGRDLGPANSDAAAGSGRHSRAATQQPAEWTRRHGAATIQEPTPPMDPLLPTKTTSGPSSFNTC